MERVFITPQVGKSYKSDAIVKLTKEDSNYYYFSNGMRWRKDFPFDLKEVEVTAEKEVAPKWNDRALTIANFLDKNAISLQLESLRVDAKRYAEMHLAAIKNSRGGRESTMRQAYASNLTASTGTEILMFEQALEILEFRVA